MGNVAPRVGVLPLISRFFARSRAGQFKCLLSSLTFTLLVTPSFAVAAEPVSLERLKHDTLVLSSDAFEGRAPLTPGEDKAVSYIADAMKQIGLKPGVGESYLQPVPMLQSETLTDPEPRLTVTGPSGSASFSYQHDITLNTARNAPRVNIEGSKVVFVGYGINAPEKHWNDYAGADVRGKTVLILINDPDWRNPTTQGAFAGKAMTYYGRYDYKFKEAARQGAAAAIVIHSDAAAGYPFSVPASSLAAATDVLDRSGEDSNPLSVQSWMTRRAAEKLMQTAGQNLDELEKAAGRADFKARPVRSTTPRGLRACWNLLGCFNAAWRQIAPSSSFRRREKSRGFSVRNIMRTIPFSRLPKPLRKLTWTRSASCSAPPATSRSYRIKPSSRASSAGRRHPRTAS